jgi:hypothetical protein
MREAMHQDGVETRIAENDFEDTFRCGILAKDGIDLFLDGAKHGLNSASTRLNFNLSLPTAVSGDAG